MTGTQPELPMESPTGTAKEPGPQELAQDHGPGVELAPQPHRESTQELIEQDPLLRLAVEKDLDIAKLEKLIELRDRERAGEAARAFAEAMAKFQAKCPPIDRGKLVHYVTKGGVTVHYRHAELKDIQAVINPIAAPLGLSYSWSNRVEGGKLVTTCIVMHALGHSISRDFIVPIESNNPGISEQQKPAAALTFGERYTLIQAFGLVTQDPDTDGTEADVAKISEQQAADLEALAQEVGVDLKRILQAAKVEHTADIPVSRYSSLVRSLERRRAQPKDGAK